MPDYDFFVPDAMSVAKQIADLYFRKGYTSVEAKSSIYKNTYKSIAIIYFTKTR